MRHKQKKRQTILSLFLLPVIALTVFALLQPQRTQQFAQQIYTGPPLFGCLQVGEGKTETCGTRLGKQLGQTFTLHGRPLNGQPVYYGDRLEGSLEYTNVGDLPINIENLTLYAESGITNKRVTFLPGSGRTTLKPGESFKTNEASYRFNWDDPRGAWSVGGILTDNNRQSAEVSDQKENIIVNATCTALRIQELTEKDKANLKALCNSNPKSKLCSSRQYCEIFKGEGCTQQNVSAETDRWQCDEFVYLPKPEQDLLEEFCKVYPDTDACKDFCARSLDSKLCPDKYLFIDAYTGKPIKFKHPRAVFVRDPEGLQFKYSKDYPTDKARIHNNVASESALTLGMQTVRVPENIDTALTLGIQTAPVPENKDTDSTQIAAWGLKTPIGCLGTCEPPGQAQAPPAWGLNTPVGCVGTCGVRPPEPGATGAPGAPAPGAPAPGAPAPGAPAPGAPITCGPKERIGPNGLCEPIPVMPECFPEMVAAKTCLAEVCNASDANCEARNQKLFTFHCNARQCDPRTAVSCPKQFVPAGGGCRTAAPPAPLLPVGAAPAQCGIPGTPPCNLEKNNLPPDPAKGRIADPATCDPKGNPIPPATKCTSLTIPESAVDGDLGYAKECRSKRRDVNPIDDPSGVNQFSCCANSISLREGCCGQDCGVWSQKAGPDGRIVYRDGAGRICTNNADVEQNNFCAGVDKDGVNRTRENTIPRQLRGTGGLTQKAPPGFLPQQPGTLNATCDVQNGNCGSGLVCKSIGGRQGICEPADQPPASDKIAPDQDAKCGKSYENVRPFWFKGTDADPSAQCCANNCQSGACHSGNLPWSPMYCDKLPTPAAPPPDTTCGGTCTDPGFICTPNNTCEARRSSGLNDACFAPDNCASGICLDGKCRDESYTPAAPPDPAPQPGTEVICRNAAEDIAQFSGIFVGSAAAGCAAGAVVGAIGAGIGAFPGCIIAGGASGTGGAVWGAIDHIHHRWTCTEK